MSGASSMQGATLVQDSGEGGRGFRVFLHLDDGGDVPGTHAFCTGGCVQAGSLGSAFVGDGGGYVLLGRQCVCVGGGSAFVGGICSWADNVWGWCLHEGEVGAGTGERGRTGRHLPAR